MRNHARDDIDMLYAEDDLLREDSYEGEGSHYKGYIFDGDTDGLNVHYLEDWSNVASILNCYGGLHNGRGSDLRRTLGGR